MIYIHINISRDDDAPVVTLTFAESNGRTLLAQLTEVPSRAVRDAIIQSGMEAGMQDAMASRVAALADLAYDARHEIPMSQRVCVMGVAGAGKTVVGRLLADALGVAYLDGDDVHPAENKQRMAQGIPLTDDDRRGWLATIAARLGDARRTGAGLVVSCSALKRAYRDVLRSADADLKFVHLTGDRALIAQRLSQRVGHYMPASLLESQLATLEPPASDEHAWTLDLADTPESIVAEIVARLQAARPA